MRGHWFCQGDIGVWTSGRKRETEVPTKRTHGAAGRVTRTARGVTRLVAAVCCAAAANVSGAAEAQDPRAGNKEVPIGTFTLGTPHDGFSIVEPPAGVPERRRDSADDGSGRWFFQGWNTTPLRSTSPEDLYEDAMKALEAGRRDDAQRLFERLIATAPDSPRARPMKRRKRSTRIPSHSALCSVR